MGLPLRLKTPPLGRRAPFPAVWANWCAILGLCAGLLAPPAAAAQPRAHVHGLLRLEVAVDAGRLVVMLEAPLDSLLGFERRPRTADERRVADAALARLNDVATLWQPDAAARCTLAHTEVEAEVLQPAAKDPKTPPAPTAGRQEEDGHAELTARYAFDCAAPGQLRALTHGLFDAFPRLQRIEVQVAGPRGQSRRVLQRPAKEIRLGR